jgi:hypothetical protein
MTITGGIRGAGATADRESTVRADEKPAGVGRAEEEGCRYLNSQFSSIARCSKFRHQTPKRLQKFINVV